MVLQLKPESHKQQTALEKKNVGEKSETKQNVPGMESNNFLSLY